MQSTVSRFRGKPLEIVGHIGPELPHNDVGSFQKSVLKRMQVQIVAFRRQITESPGHQPAGKIPDTCSNFEHIVTEVRTNEIANPTHVLRSAS